MSPSAPAPLASNPGTAPGRVVSVDAYRGLVMLLMLGEVLALRRVAEALPESRFWAFLAHHQSHVEWVGCSLHDLIQPSFSFLVGVAVPFSLANRLARGASVASLWAHALWRAVVLVALGIFLRSLGHPRTYFTFEDTLTQIGLGYFFLFALAWTPPRVQWAALGVILFGYWLAFALYPLPGPDFDWARAGVAADWPHHLTGFAAHWNKNTNLAWAFDTWFLNLFPREAPFTHNGGGYATLSFIPTLGTMILGLLAGGWLRRLPATGDRVRWFALVGLTGLALGWLLGALGVCPVVKRIWTPSWVLYSGGWCFLLLAGFGALVEGLGWKAAVFPLVVVGMNSIAAYGSEWLAAGFIRDALNRHLGREFFQLLGAPYEPLLRGAAVLLVLWLILYWMYRRKIFLKI
jgi:LPXTG-motif cell wall-anchored protein